MLSELPDGDAADKEVHRLLLKADAYNRWPTPVGDLVAAAGLVEAKHSMFSDFVLDQAPAHIQSAIRKMRNGGKIRAILDRKEREVHLDPLIAQKGKEAFHKLHEVCHDIYPWQSDLAYADDDMSFAPGIKTLFERQANQGAAELLFQRDRFTDMARNYATDMASVVALSKTVGASIHATFRRFVETRGSAVAGVVLDASPRTRSPLVYARHEALFSALWKERFGGSTSWPSALATEPYTFIKLADNARASAQAVPGTFVLPDLRNEPITLDVELYCNKYNILVLMWVPRREWFRKRVVIASATGPLVSAR